MPTAALHVCATTGCPSLTDQSYCPTCRAQRSQQHYARQAKVYGDKGRRISFYSSKLWKALRAQVRQEEPLCRNHAICGGVSEHIDHIRPREQGGPDTRANLQSLCLRCHGEKTLREQRNPMGITDLSPSDIAHVARVLRATKAALDDDE